MMSEEGSAGRQASIRNKQMVVVGDRALILPDSDRDRTEHGLYLPPGVKEREKVQSGYIVKVGPGYPVPNPNYLDQESWSTSPKEPVKYIPLQAEEGDYAIFLRDQAIEIEYDGTKYLIVSQGAILMLIRATPWAGPASGTDAPTDR
ncbi:MAG TPA: co-chaperone GroES family protein [Bacteroidota bacterium]|nr:co-chaperone GroES family protein [Bacteroidota bacterium]